MCPNESLKMSGTTDLKVMMKDMMLRDIKEHHNKIQKFVDDTYNFAESSVQLLLSNPNNCLEDFKNINNVVQQYCNKLIPLSQLVTEVIELKYPEGQSNSIPNLKVQLPEINFGKQYSVELLSPGTPSRFWLKISGKSVSGIEKHLKSFYTSKEHLKNPPSLNAFFVCLHQDKFCRCKVVTLLDTTPEVDVVLIDYGDNVTTTVDKLFEIDEQFCFEPAIGMLCCIDDLNPISSTWELEAVGYFNIKCSNDLNAIFHQTANHEIWKDDTFSNQHTDFFVSLIRKDPTGEVQIETEMIKKGWGKKIKCNKPPSGSESACAVDAFSQKSIVDSNSRVSNSVDHQLKDKGWTSQLRAKTEKTNKSSCLTSNNPGPFDSRFNVNVPCFVPSVSPFRSLPPPGFPAIHHNVSTRPRTPTRPRAPTQPRNARLTSNNVDRSVNHPVRLSSVSNSAVRLPMPTSTSKLDEIDQMLSGTPKPNKSESHGVNMDEPCPRQADTLIMQQFLRSLPSPPETARGTLSRSDSSQSFFTASTHVSDRAKCPNVIEASCTQELTELDYEFEAVLTSRSLPFLKTNSLEFWPSYVISPTHFYVYADDDLSASLIPFIDRLSHLYRNSKPVPVSQPEEGSFWVVKEKKDEEWARVRVVNLILEEKSVKVFFVDYGYEGVVEISQLRPLVKEIINFPCMAIRCCLGGIYPIGKKGSEEWSELATAKFIEFLGFGKLTRAIVSSTLEPNGALSLVVLDEFDEEKLSANEYLIQIGVASSDVFKVDPIVIKNVAEDDDEDFDEDLWNPNAELRWDPMAEDFFSHKNSLAHDSENYDSVTTGYIPQDEAKICRFFKANGTCYKGIKCAQLHCDVDQKKFTSDQTEIFVRIPEMSLPPPGSWVAVQVTVVLSPIKMFVILPYGTRNLEYATAEAEEFETIETIQDSLQEEYNANFHQHRFTVTPALSEIVVARSSHDKRWYRGIVMADDADEMFAVFFLDSGNSEIVHLGNLCSILPRFVHFPAQAVEVSLNGVCQDETVSDAAGREALSQLVKEKDLIAKVVDTWPVLCVDLFNTSGPKDINIVEELIAMKVVKPSNKAVAPYSVVSYIPG